MTRRELLAMTALAPFSPGTECPAGGGARSDGRLRARPGRPTTTLTAGLHPLGLGDERDGFLYVPTARPDAKPATLLIHLHGAGNRARISETLQRLADEFAVIVLAPDSRGRTWDAVLGPLGPDVAFIDRALASVFSGAAIDRRRVAIGGFSDGASYALTLGTINGDLFAAILAFSPGFLGRGDRRGSPRIFVSHGTRDEILPIDRTSRRLVPALEDLGYRVSYREFDGPHTVPEAIARDGFEWLAR